MYRDGIVDNTGEVVTKGKYGSTPVLPLLTGKEVDGRIAGLTVYSREGSVKDMQFALLLHTGSKVRVLRGSDLDSKYAPAAGIRYDGE